jgi:hypothetical protein
MQRRMMQAPIAPISAHRYYLALRSIFQNVAMQQQSIRAIRYNR